MRRTKWPAAVAGALTLAATRASAADDAPAKPAEAPKLLLKLAQGTTYVYRFTETTTRVDVPKIDLEGAPPGTVKLEHRSEVIWDVGVTLAETAADGSLAVSLMVTRA